MAPLKCTRMTRVLISALGTVTYIFFLWLCRKCAPLFSDVTLQQNVTDSKVSKFWNPLEILRKGYERLPFPVENTGHLPTAFSAAATCKKTARYLFFIHTAPGNFGHRTIMRSCLGNGTFSTYYRWTSVFFVGLSADNVTAKQVGEEASQNGDVVVLPYRGVYRNLTYKFVYGMKWTIENCPSVKYIVKMDDDFVVNVVKVISYLETRSKAKNKGFYCYVYSNARVCRDVKSKWYLSEEIYAPEKFPRYCAGGGTMFNARALWGLYNASFSIPFHGVDDVYVTGDASLIAGVKLIALNGFYSFLGNDRLGVTSGKTMFSQLRDPIYRASAWSDISGSLANNIKTEPVTKANS